MKLPYYVEQMEVAFVKLQKANSLSMEAMRQFYDAKFVALIDNEPINPDTTVPNPDSQKLTLKSSEKIEKSEPVKNTVKESSKVKETEALKKQDIPVITRLKFDEHDNAIFPSGLTAVKVPLKELVKKEKKEDKSKKLIFCRDCHKRITGEIHSIGNNLSVCSNCLEKRKRKLEQGD